MNILITIPEGAVRDTFLPAPVLEALRQIGSVRMNDLGRQYTGEELKKAVSDAEIAVTGWGTPALRGETIEGNGTLRLIVHTGGSVADLVGADTYEKGIRVLSGNRLYAESVAEGTIAYMLAALRHIPDETAVIKNGGWKNAAFEYNEALLGREVGILGVGTIARDLMQMLRAFRCTFRVWDNYRVDPAFLASVHAEQCSMEEVLSSCRIVSIHAALNDSTRGMIGKQELSLLPEGALLVNTSRGAILREAELTELLEERPDLHAVLDVFEKEPLPADSRLRKLPNVYLMPHRAGPTVDYRAVIGKALAEDILHFTRGEEMTHEIPWEAAARMTTQKH